MQIKSKVVNDSIFQKKMLTFLGTLTATTAAADHLFQVRNKEETTLLPEDKAIQFHLTVAQLLLVST